MLVWTVIVLKKAWKREDSLRSLHETVNGGISTQRLFFAEADLHEPAGDRGFLLSAGTAAFSAVFCGYAAPCISLSSVSPW